MGEADADGDGSLSAATHSSQEFVVWSDTVDLVF